MCDPISAVIGIGSAVIGAGSKIYQGREQEKAAKANAAEAKAVAQTNYQAHLRNLQRDQGGLINANASTGFTLDGSPSFIMDDFTRESMVEANQILRTGEFQSQEFLRKGKTARRNAYMGAASSFLGTSMPGGGSLGGSIVGLF